MGLHRIDFADDLVKGSTIWTIREHRPGGIVEVWRKRNIITSYGLTALASAFGGTYAQPVYLMLDNKSATLNASYGTLVTSVVMNARIDNAGDTQIVLGVGTANEETIAFSAVSGSGPYTYTVSATTKAHTSGDNCCRAVRGADTLASIQSEFQYDSVNFPGARLRSTGFYSSGTGNGTMQFFLTGAQAVGRWESLGTSENAAVGAGNLHNHLTLGYNHTAGVDVEIDIALTLS
jgi:hypothetical protein